MSRAKFYKSLYFQVLVAIAIGILLGAFAPAFAVTLKPLGDGFIKLIRMLIAPIIFCTVSVGIASIGDMRKVGRVGLKALIYFEVVTTLALLIGLLAFHFIAPGAGMNIDPASLDAHALEGYATQAKSLGMTDFLLNMIPANVVDAFAKGDILQVLVFSVLFGFALLAMGERAQRLVGLIDDLSQGLFRVVSLIMRLAPLGAMGAMAFTIGKYGIGSLASLGKLMATFYLTCGVFIVFVLGAICRALDLNIFKLIGYLREELFIVLGTSSSESVLPRMMEKLERLGCSKAVVGLMIPAGYSFNLDGTSIYLTLAALFVAQATNTHLSFAQEFTILAVLLLSSKGAAGVTGSGFITLAATLSAVPTIPVAGLALILGIDRFMSEARALTNLIGNGVATLVVARWESELDYERARRVLDQDL